MSSESIRVIVEVEDGMVTDIYSTEAIEMFVLDRDVLDGRIERWTHGEIKGDPELDQMIAEYLAEYPVEEDN